MRKQLSAVFGLGVLVLTSVPAAIAGNINFPSTPEAYKTPDNSLIIAGLQPTQEILLNYPGTPRQGSARANACGAVQVRGAEGVPLVGTIKVDGVSIDTTSLNTQLLPPCVNGQFQEPRTTNFKTFDGSIVVVGKTPNGFFAIETSEDAQCWVRANDCGFVVVKPNNRFTHGATTQITSTSINSGLPVTLGTMPSKPDAPLCRSGKAFWPVSWGAGS